jgi:hypothetical protein
MFLTTLFAYIGSLSPSAQVWCGDQYLKDAQVAFGLNNSVPEPAQTDNTARETFQSQMSR